MKYPFVLYVVFGCLLVLTQCSRKDADKPAGSSLRFGYGETEFLIKEEPYSILPKSAEAGSYYAVPNNLPIDKKTGRITITANDTSGTSLAGLWYKVFFYSAATDKKDSTLILLKGVNYVDAFLNQNDGSINPVFNGNPATPMPAGKYNFEIKGKKYRASNTTGKINIAELIKAEAEELARRNYVETEITYTATDAKVTDEKATHKLNVVLYQYQNFQSVPQNVSELMQLHQSMTFGYSTPPIQSTMGKIATDLPQYLDPARGALFKPRPPCIVIIGH